MKYLFLIFLLILGGCKSPIIESIVGPSSTDKLIEYNEDTIASDFYFYYLTNSQLKQELINYEQGKPSEVIIDWIFNEKKTLGYPAVPDDTYSNALAMVYKRLNQ